MTSDNREDCSSESDDDSCPGLEEMSESDMDDVGSSAGSEDTADSSE